MMTKIISLNMSHFLLTLLLIFVGFLAVNAEEKKTYIVYMGDLPDNSVSAEEAHYNALTAVLGSLDSAKKAIMQSYTKSFNAFAAKLTQEEAKKLREMDTVASVQPSKTYKLHTTRSWDFIGLPVDVKRNPQQESDIIIGVIDGGINESESFDDEGFGPPPAKWKGSCVNFTGCNNKLIGAQYFRSKDDDDYDPEEVLSPADHDGHGTHVASIAAGRIVEGASMRGIGAGTVRGAVPGARIAMYKACWSHGCNGLNVLSAFEAAIADGVDIISVSFGSDNETSLLDPVSIGSFHAMKKGILTAVAGGNFGSMGIGTIHNSWPWAVTVAASNTDQRYRTKVELGNGDQIYGSSLNPVDPNGTFFPLATGAQVVDDSLEAPEFGMMCVNFAMDPNKVKGKIICCTSPSGGSTKKALAADGALGGILLVDGIMPYAPYYPFPAVIVEGTSNSIMDHYINETDPPHTAMIYQTEAYESLPAPTVAAYSARGPNPYSIHLLKPDITAPGTEIMAAWSNEIDGKLFKYYIDSGTSMACPHVSGVAAYIKTFHPTWSPAAIKSAIMTTATPMNDAIKEWAYGAGHLNPVQALDPGLVYDANETSFIQHLCHEGVDGEKIKGLGMKSVDCSSMRGEGIDGINYPSMQFGVSTGGEASGEFVRTVTNVGDGPATYTATVTAPDGLSITVEPSTLSFSQTLETKTFHVKVTAKPLSEMSMISGQLVWSDSKHHVRSPIVVQRV